MFLTLLVLLLIDLEPLRQSSVDLKIEKETFPYPRRCLCIVFPFLYGYQFCESAVISLLSLSLHLAVCELRSEACLNHVLMLIDDPFLELKEMEQYSRKVLI